ncbi:MAG: transposase [Dehalococcoidia bacterium]|jgi:transposase/predicted nucleic acid-binding Zn finger protein
MDAREERGLVIAATSKIEKNKLGWKVPSQSGNGSYVVNLDHGEPFCTCPDFETRHLPCKHIHAVEYVIQRETKPDGTVTYTEAIKVTYNQEWHTYNAAQTHESERFVRLLRELCAGIEQPTQTFGRPRLALSDVIFALAFKVYSTMSGRRFTSDLLEAQNDGLLTKAPHYNSAFRYLENPKLTPLLKALIEQSASPLRAVETDFAVDSSGFSTTTYSRWFDHKYGKERTRQTWVKTHLMCGVKTHVVTSVEATPYESADNRQFPKLVSNTAKIFDINEVSADKAYSGRQNLHVVQNVGGTAYIPFMSHSTGKGDHHHKFDGLWQRMWHFYNFNRETFLQHYHKRSNVETTFSMIKAKFGSSVRAKSPTAQVNEVLCKVLCHNICVPIQSIYELGLEPTFWTFEAEGAVAPKVLENTGF